MTKYILRRLLFSIPVVFLIILAAFILVHAMPGGPFDARNTKPLPPAVRELLERRYGLDKPLVEQFFLYMGNLLRGEFGPMFSLQSQDVNDIIAQTFPVSFQVGILSLGVGLLIGVPAGIIAALNHNSILDYFSTFVAVLGVSIPNLVLAPVLILVFAVNLGWFPVAFWGADPPFTLGLFPKFTSEFWMHAVLPTVALGTGISAAIARLTRAGLLEVLAEDYIRTARAKGVRERAVIVVHALKNSLIPVVTILGPLFAAVVTGTLVIEQIFAINGMGRRFIASIAQREYFLLTGLTLVYGIILVASNLMVDIVYAWLDPRIKYT
jgi:oligopeptide transport system permease protein